MASNWRRRRRLRRQNGNGGFPLWGKLLIALGLLAVTGAAAVAISGVAVYQYYARDFISPDEALANQASSGAKIYDRNGRLLYQFVDDLSGLRNPIPLSDVSQYLIDATVATEDNTFWDNPGVNYAGLVRAAWENFVPGPELGFLEGSGGSSITQQLVKNIYIDPTERTQRSVQRKLKETVYAIELTDRYSKEQILELYLNQISYGGIYNGVEAAALGYFGKHAADLSLAEAALLAGIPAHPARYDPITNPDEAKARRSQVLDLMISEGMVSPEQALAAKLEPIELAPQRFPIEAPHFVLTYVQPELEEIIGPDRLYRGGLTVTTTLDLDLQDAANAILEQWISEFEEQSDGHNGSLVAIDPKTGEILVMVGSRDYFRDDILGRNNMATALNSPGSSFKPFAYMASFIELGWGPGTLILDTPVSYTEADGDVFSPRNPAGDYKGPITIRQALGNSLNVPAFKMAQATGVENVVKWGRRMGITGLDGFYGPSIAIGGVDVRLLDMTYGYSVFANNGLMRGMPTLLDLPEGSRTLDPIAILKVEDSRGNVIWEPERQESQVVDAQYPYLVTSILTDANSQCATFGCGGISIPGQPAGVKTGTSEPYEDSRAIGDTWAFAYTGALSVGVWAGNADNSPMVNILSTSIAFRSTRDFMLLALEGQEPEGIPQPDGIVRATVCVPSGKLPTDDCPKTTEDIFAANSVPTEKDDWYKKLKIDIRNGLLATGKTPDRFVEEQVFLVLPPELEGTNREQAEEWAAALGVPLAPTEQSPLGADTAGDSGSAFAGISSPATRSKVNDVVVIVGTANTPDFVSYRLEYSKGFGGTGWTVIEQSTEPVEGGPLGVLDTRDLEPGVYSVRLVVVDKKLGQVGASIFLQVTDEADSSDGGDAGEGFDNGPTSTPSPGRIDFNDDDD